MERKFIDWLRTRLPSHPCLRLGVGDDAALLELASGQAVVTVDIITDGVDFRLGQCDPRRVGRKALAINLSDLAAMAAVPRAAVVGLVLPRAGGYELAQALFEGLLPLAEQFSLAIAGGDTNSWDGPLAISITAIGEPTARGVLRRDGARPGDQILVIGQFGGSLLGHHFDFIPRVAEALALHARYSIHAAIDVSDGLSLDVSRLAAASDCGAVLDLSAIPVAPAAVERAKTSGRTALEHALGDGEDFELVLAVPPQDAERLLNDQPLGVKLTWIGELIAEQGLWQREARDLRSPLEPRGYEHTL